MYTAQESENPLPNSELIVLVYSIRSADQVGKVFQLLERQVATRENVVNDWHLRKQQYVAFCKVCVKLNTVEYIYTLVGDLDTYQIPTYFAKDLIFELGGNKKVDPAVLRKIAELVQQQRGPEDKGVKGAFYELLVVLKDRGLHADFTSVYDNAMKLKIPLPEGMKKQYDALQVVL